MRISRVCIENYRNFKSLDVELGQNIILVGENKSGKTNFIQALRLILDPSLSDNDRLLTEQDFWDGDGEAPFDGREIKVVIQFSDFANEDSPELPALSWLCDGFIATEPERIAQITYTFFKDRKTDEDLSDNNQAMTQDDYDFKIFLGNNSEKKFNTQMRRNIPLNLFVALRDIASDNNIWNRSPLKRLLKLIDNPLEDLQTHADAIRSIGERVVKEVPQIKNLESELQKRVKDMTGDLYKIDPKLGLNVTNPSTLIEAIRVFADGAQQRPLNRISLGLQNVLYLSLLSLELEKKINQTKEFFIPIIALEEPEAHLHPHLQRLVFEDFLIQATTRKQPVLISTHSPHLASASSIKDLVLIQTCSKNGSMATSAYKFLQCLDNRTCKDLARFLDITKSEMLFSKGVIFVEGDVEMLLIPEFAKILGNRLDEYGISVCNAYGAHFGHVITLAYNFKIPYIVLTDGDPYIKTTGLQRSIKLLENTNSLVYKELNNLFEEQQYEKIREKLQYEGVFLNPWTLEASLLDSGLSEELKHTFNELGEERGENVKSAQKHIDSYLQSKTKDNMENILSSIADKRWGKGRFAQRLVKHIIIRGESLNDQDDKNKLVPEYIKTGIEFLLKKIAG
jgi:putative ATP-dependent endonuclease of the OLD family